MNIQDCTLTKPITCFATDSIQKAAKILKDKKLRHLYVLDKKKNLLGVFAGIDVIHSVIAAGKDYKKMTVSDMMNPHIVSFAPDDALTKAIGFMSSTNIFTCPIAKDKKLVAVLSYKDAMQHALEERKNFLKTK